MDPSTRAELISLFCFRLEDPPIVAVQNIQAATVKETAESGISDRTAT
jgi:hypothetical protein